MNVSKVFIFLLRVTMGWMFAYAGLSHMLTPGWSAAGYLQGAKVLAGFYHWLAIPQIVPITNALNEWALLLLGISLLLGLFVRVSSWAGVVLMALYYIPILAFPYVGKNAFIIDEHIIYIAVLLLLANARAGRAWGLELWCSRLPICSRYPALRKLLG